MLNTWEHFENTWYVKGDENWQILGIFSRFPHIPSWLKMLIVKNKVFVEKLFTLIKISKKLAYTSKASVFLGQTTMT